ncbi:MAG: VOC family protein [Alphaproteobacteria bacterium]|nr:VOC family protein [Alphaproteobacteria bacterium]
MAGGLDHLVVVARDLERQADLYRRLGFKVGARNRHNWGTLNHIVQFDGVFLELLSLEPGFVRPASAEPVARFTDPITRHLAEREGLAMMVLEGHDAAQDHAAFNAAGIGVPETFYFARQGRRPDGSTVEVAFSLAFAQSEAIDDAGFFVCQQHAPEMFWNRDFQVHQNGAKGVARIIFVADDPERHDSFFTAYTGVDPVRAASGGRHYGLERGAVDVMTRQDAAGAFGAEALPRGLDTPRFAAIEFDVEAVTRVVAKLIESDIPFGKRGDSIVVPAEHAMGVMLVFSERE